VVRGALGLFLLVASARAALAAEPAPTCRDLQLGERWVCCLADDGARCAPNPMSLTSTDWDFASVPATRAEDFVGPRAMFIPRMRGADALAILGDTLCERRDGQLACAPDIKRANELPALLPVPGAPVLAMSAGADRLATSLHRKSELSGTDQRLCAVHADGGVTCHWRSYPRRGEGLREIGAARGRFTQVSTGHGVACALDDAGRVSCWFLPDDPSSGVPTKPIFLVDALEKVAPRRKAVALASFASGTCAALEAGDGSDVVCWGYTSALRVTPVHLPRVRTLSMGREAVCALLESGGVRCWKPSARDVPTAPPSLPPGSGATRVVVGARQACALHDRGLTCWRTDPPAGPAPVVVVAPPPVPAPPPKPEWKPPPPPPRQWMWHGAIPFSWGHGWYHTRERHSSGTWLRLRPEILWGPEKLAQSTSGPWAVGPYAELAWHPVDGSKRVSVGAGVSGLVWIHQGFVVQPSFGWYRQDHGALAAEHGVQGGLFVGFADPGTWGPLLVPHGARLDVRRGLGARDERSLLLAGEFDALDVVLIPTAFVLLMTADWRFD
jgi:hypothetical protein